MPEKKLSLDRGGPERLKISWSGIWKNFTVELDGRTLGVIEGGMSALKAGRGFPLGDGSQLNVQLVQGFGTSELQILRDGVPVPGSQSDPQERFKAAWMMIFVVAGLNAAAGLIALIFNVEALLQMGAGAGSLIVAAVYAGLGYWTRAGRSKAGLGIAMGLLILDGIFSGRASGIVARIFLLIPMYRGFAAIDAMGNPPTRTPSGPAAAAALPSAAPKANPVPLSTAAGQKPCVFCQLPFPQTELVQVNGKSVCKNCAAGPSSL